eukprot:gene25700-34277_t
MLNSLYTIFSQSKQSGNETASGKLLSIDLLTPGLNPRLEQKAILSQELLFSLVVSLMPLLLNNFSNIRLAFQSTGDAAGFQKYCSRFRVEIPDSIVPTDVSIARLDRSVDCIVFVAAKNNVGDPVINEIRKIRAAYPSVCGLLVNCDLSDKVLSGGMKGKADRDSFRSSIAPAFYFRNIVSISRPSMEPTELGAMVYTVSEGWKLYAANSQDIDGPGSLNRFMSQAVFARSPSDPTAERPPAFLEVYAHPEARPSKDDISGMETRVKVVLSRSRQKQPRFEDDEAAADRDQQPNFFQAFLNSINSQLRRVTQGDSASSASAASPIEGDGGSQREQGEESESDLPPPTPAADGRMTMLDISSLDPQ